MKVLRAVGLILFLAFANVLLGDVVRSVSRTAVATLETIETASHTATAQMQKIK